LWFSQAQEGRLFHASLCLSATLDLNVQRSFLFLVDCSTRDYPPLFPVILGLKLHAGPLSRLFFWFGQASLALPFFSSLFSQRCFPLLAMFCPHPPPLVSFLQTSLRRSRRGLCGSRGVFDQTRTRGAVLPVSLPASSHSCFRLRLATCWSALVRDQFLILLPLRRRLKVPTCLSLPYLYVVSPLTSRHFLLQTLNRALKSATADRTRLPGLFEPWVRHILNFLPSLPISDVLADNVRRISPIFVCSANSHKSYSSCWNSG